VAYALARTAAVYPQNGNVAVLLEVAFSGADLPPEMVDGVLVQINVEWSGSAQPAAIRTAMSNAVVAKAREMGITVAGGDMVIPTFQKG
jgi:hypothetical protein